ncbi:MAG: DUF5654 family protein [Methanomassiliicoccales archaeon]
MVWNTAIADASGQAFPNPADKLTGEFVYAIIVTILAVVATFLIARSIAKLKDIELIASDKKKEDAKK